MSARPQSMSTARQPDQLVDTAAIAQLLGVSRRHVTERMSHQPDFPAPLVNRSQKLRRWSLAQVLAWSCGSDSEPPPALGQALVADAVRRPRADRLAVVESGPAPSKAQAFTEGERAAERHLMNLRNGTVKPGDLAELMGVAADLRLAGFCRRIELALIAAGN